eukprot:328678-Prymnesium_polylepis.2
MVCFGRCHGLGPGLGREGARELGWMRCTHVPGLRLAPCKNPSPVPVPSRVGPLVPVARGTFVHASAQSWRSYAAYTTQSVNS